MLVGPYPSTPSFKLLFWLQNKKVSRRTTKHQPQVQPAKPRELLYTNRQINLAEAAQSESSEQNCWKVIVAHRLDSKSIIGVVSLDAKLIILSIVQRINIPSSASPSMTRSCSEGSLSGGKYNTYFHSCRFVIDLILIVIFFLSKKLFQWVKASLCWQRGLHASESDEVC